MASAGGNSGPGRVIEAARGLVDWRWSEEGLDERVQLSADKLVATDKSGGWYASAYGSGRLEEPALLQVLCTAENHRWSGRMELGICRVAAGQQVKRRDDSTGLSLTNWAEDLAVHLGDDECPIVVGTTATAMLAAGHVILMGQRSTRLGEPWVVLACGPARTDDRHETATLHLAVNFFGRTDQLHVVTPHMMAAMSRAEKRALQQPERPEYAGLSVEEWARQRRGLAGAARAVLRPDRAHWKESHPADGDALCQHLERRLPLYLWLRKTGGGASAASAAERSFTGTRPRRLDDECDSDGNGAEDWLDVKEADDVQDRPGCGLLVNEAECQAMAGNLPWQRDEAGWEAEECATIRRRLWVRWMLGHSGIWVRWFHRRRAVLWRWTLNAQRRRRRQRRPGGQ